VDTARINNLKRLKLFLGIGGLVSHAYPGYGHGFRWP